MHRTPLAVAAVAGAALFIPSPAFADITPDAPFVATDAGATIVDSNTVVLDQVDADGTSVETSSLNVAVEAGDVISVEYRLADGAVCTAGAPRLFVEIGGQFTNTFDTSGCGTPIGGGTFLLTLTAPQSGVIDSLGLVLDNGTEGTVTFENLKVDGELVLFKPRPVDPEPEPEAAEIQGRLSGLHLRGTNLDRLHATARNLETGDRDADGALVRYFRINRDDSRTLVAKGRLNENGSNFVRVVDSNGGRDDHRYIARIAATEDTLADTTNFVRVR